MQHATQVYSPILQRNIEVRSSVEKAEIRQKWMGARKELESTFPSVPTALWHELENLNVGGAEYQIPAEGDVLVHAYLLSQMFCLSVMSIINKHVDQVPVHATLGCVGPGVHMKISVQVDGLENANKADLEKDFHDHLAHERARFKSHNIEH